MAVGLRAASALDDNAGASVLEPPDSGSNLASSLSSLSLDPCTRIEGKSSSVAISLGSSCPPPIQCNRASDKPHHASTASFGVAGSSYGSRFPRHPTLTPSASMDSHSSLETYSTVPPSPSMSEGLTDSPGSVSSMNSYRRGDLADIEDLDLEPELETVSECDEESSSLCSTDVLGDMDSDSERASSGGAESEPSTLGLSLPSSLGRNGTLKALASGSPASDYARRKRSEWYLNSYASKIASRRPRKVKRGRVAEIVEEGGGDINTTVMPRPSFACTSGEWSCEVIGPPASVPRTVSPSDTVPAVPSPLCECISADASHGGEIGPASAAMNDSVETVKALQGDSCIACGDGVDAPAILDMNVEPLTGPIPSETKSLPETTQPSRESLSTRVSRPRRESSPPRLRPCFRRRTSAQSGTSTRDSSCEREAVRGRSVRFSPAPPLELRTHSPVEYDRKSCPVNNRLSPADVEELRTMKMEMGLLEAKWAADAACKVNPPGVEPHEDNGRGLSDAAHNAGIAALNAADRNADATPASSLGHAHMTIAARVRLQKEREREKERQKQLPRARTAVRPQHDCDSVRAKFGQAPPPPLPGLPPSHVRATSPRSSSAPPVSRTPSEERAFQALLTGPESLKRASEVPTLTQTGPSPPPSPLERPDERLSGAWRSSNVTLGKHLGVGYGDGSAPRGRQLGAAASLTAPSVSSSSSARLSSQPRPANMPASWTPPPSRSSPPTPSYPGAGSFSGYDSPASGEFYESGSEYDLIA